ncbi:MAG: O-antigen ligase family protein [Bacteroidota bacterium]
MVSRKRINLKGATTDRRHFFRQRILWICCICFSASLFFSRFLLTVFMISFIALAVFDWREGNKGFYLRLNPALSKGWQYFTSHRGFWFVTLFFFLVLVGGLYNEDWGYFTERLRIKLPFLLLPVAFAVLPTLNNRYYNSIFYAFLLFAFVSCIGVVVNYVLNQAVILENISKGQAIPTPINHIRYSLMLAFATLSGFVLYHKQFYWRYRWERWLILSVSVGLFVFLHFLSVRSGLIVLYLSIAWLIARYIWITRRWLVGLGALILMISLPYLAFQLMPSFRTKYYYARYDLEMYWKGEGESYSDSERLVSYRVGWELVKEHPLIGVGMGNLRRAVEQSYEVLYPDLQNRKMPHNQLLSVLAGSGILGLLFFLWAFFTPLFHRAAYRDIHLLILHLLIFLSFMVENTIENAIGVAFYIFFLVIGLNHQKAGLEVEK